MYVLPFCKIIVYILFMGNNKLYFLSGGTIVGKCIYNRKSSYNT